MAHSEGKPQCVSTGKQPSRKCRICTLNLSSAHKTSTPLPSTTKTVMGRMAIEVMFFDSNGNVSKVIVHSTEGSEQSCSTVQLKAARYALSSIR